MTTAESNTAFAVWMTGLPASGKSAITLQLVRLLRDAGIEVEVLESDTLRRFFAAESAYDEGDRRYFYAAVAFIAQALTSRGVPVIVDATANRRAYRERARQIIPRFIEVYVACPVDVCILRDPKGLYRRALADPNNQMPGLGARYEPPEHPEVVVHSDEEAPEAAARRIIESLAEKGCIRLPQENRSEQRHAREE